MTSSGGEKSGDSEWKSLLVFAPFVALHIWSVVLNFQVNGFGAWGWFMGMFTLWMPFLAELLWGFWALAHGHVYAIGVIVVAVWTMVSARMLGR